MTDTNTAATDFAPYDQDAESWRTSLPTHLVRIVLAACRRTFRRSRLWLNLGLMRPQKITSQGTQLAELARENERLTDELERLLEARQVFAERIGSLERAYVQAAAMGGRS